MDANAAADAFFYVPDRTEFFHVQRFYRELFALLDAGTAADAAGRVELGFRHAHDAEVVHTDFTAVVRTARKSYLYVQVIRENSLFDAFCQCCRIVIAEGADMVADASHDITRTGRFVADALLGLVDIEFINDRLQCFVYCLHLFVRNAEDFEALTDSQMYFAIAEAFSNIFYLAQDLCIQEAAGNTYTSRCDTAFFRDAERVFL